MPRISPSLIRQAVTIDRLLPSLLPVCRDLRSAQNELKWLKQHALEVGRKPNSNSLLSTYVLRRALGEPLQYILGSEFFGELEIKCRPGVLIPRQDTANSVSNLARLISKNRVDDTRRLGLLDVCTGSGCIPLLFHHEFYSNSTNSDTRLEIAAIDISEQALSLARDNIETQIELQSTSHSDVPIRSQSLGSMEVTQADVLNKNGAVRSVVQALESLNQKGSAPSYEILISNPPYISTRSFRTTTARSVRKFEPKLALVPDSGSGKRYEDQDGDLFYPRLLHLAEQVNAKIFLFEVADLDQAIRVATLTAATRKWDKIEIWRDEPASEAMQQDEVIIGNTSIRIRGAGNGRSVVATRGSAAGWIDE